MTRGLDTGRRAVQPTLMSTAKTIVIFGSYAPSLVNFRGALISEMAKRSHRVVTVAPQITPSTAEAIRKLGGEPHELYVSNQSLNPFGMLRTMRALRRLLSARCPEVFIAYTIKPVVLGAIAAKAEGVPKVISLITGAGYAFTGGREPRRTVSRIVATQLYRFALRRSDWVVFQNQDDEAMFREAGMISDGQDVLRVNGSGVDVQHFGMTPQPAVPSFLMISRLLKDKGVREFTAAAKRLKAEHPQVAIHLVGYIDSSPDSISEAELEIIRNSGIHFHGRLDDVRPAIAACSVYVLPSYREGSPRSVLEAMAMGRAIITTDAPGCRETVTREVNGLLVPPRDAEALYRAMLRFVAEPELAARMGKVSRTIAEAKFDVHRVNADLLRVADL